MNMQLVRHTEKSWMSIRKKWQKQPVILVMADGKLRELQKKLKGDCTLEFVTTKDHIGFETYKRTVCLVLLRAIYDVAGKENIEKS